MTEANAPAAVAGNSDISPAGHVPNGLPPQDHDQPPKKNSRQRFLRGISRISSSPALVQTAPHPYKSRASLSCVSLTSAAATTISHPSSPGAYSTAPSSRPASPGIHPHADGIDSVLSIRKVDRDGNIVDSTSVPLPHELVAKTRRKRPVLTWATLPNEMKFHILGFLRPKELVCASRVNKEFYNLCFDGQLWTRLDASAFYREIPAESLTKLVEAAGPFIKDLNLRGCVQVEHYKRAGAIVAACKNLVAATLEGCQNFQRATLHTLLRTNNRLTHLNLTGLSAVTNSTCGIVASHCPQLEYLNVSWCKKLDARGLVTVIRGCKSLKDLRASEVSGFASTQVARTIFETNRLERLVLRGCEDLTDTALQTMVHGTEPEIDFITDRPLVPLRNIRHLDLSRCPRVSNQGISALAHLVPHLEGLQLNRCAAIGNEGLGALVATTPNLTHLELEDVAGLGNVFLSDHLARSPCAPKLEHLSVGYCDTLGDAGMLPVLNNCGSLRSIVMDNTRVSDMVLAAAVLMVQGRAPRTCDRSQRPHIGLRMDVYDCQNITWTGVREVLSRNAKVVHASGTESSHEGSVATYPTEATALKCFYGWQMTVDEHMKRVLKGDFNAASRLERKWADYMQATEEAGVSGAGIRRRRRRAREAQLLHADEEGGTGRRRARTFSSCVVM